MLDFDDGSLRLDGKTGLVLGIVDERSLAYGCAAAARHLGARLALTYLDRRAQADVRSLARRLEAELCLPLDVNIDGGLDAVFQATSDAWGRLDFVIHSRLYAPGEELHHPLIDSSAHGFALAMDLACHSLVRVARLAAPLMTKGGTLISIGYSGGTLDANLMGLVESAAQDTVRHLDAELSPRGIRVHAVNTGSAASPAASGNRAVDRLVDTASRRSWGRKLPSVAEIGLATVLLATDAGRGLGSSVGWREGRL